MIRNRASGCPVLALTSMTMPSTSNESTLKRSNDVAAFMMIEWKFPPSR
jgi:hypothetical protein